MALLEPTAALAQPEPWVAIGQALGALAASGPMGFLLVAALLLQALSLWKDMKAAKHGEEVAEAFKRIEALEKENADEREQKKLAAAIATAREEGARAERESTGRHPRSSK